MSNHAEFDVFLAHHSGDKPLVRQISAKLKAQGLKPWIDEEQIPPGRSFQDAIQQAIPIAKTAAIILGTEGLGRWQDWEIKAIFTLCVTNQKIVIPVLLPGVKEVPEKLLFLRELRWINFDSTDDAKALDLLLWGITGQRPRKDLSDDIKTSDKTVNAQPSSFDADTLFNQALTQDELKNYAAAIELYSRVIALKPDDADVYINRGNARGALGDTEGEIADYDRALQIDPDDVDAYYNRGIARYALGDTAGATADYDRAIQIDSDDADVYTIAGWLVVL